MQIILAADDGSPVAVYPEIEPADAVSTMRFWAIVNWLANELTKVAAKEGVQS